MAVPYTFGSATTSIPLSQLDSNFATAITLGNTAVQLGNTITNLTGVSNLASAGALSLGSNGNTTAITVDTSQNVLIGTTTTVNKLTVFGTNSQAVSVTSSTGGATQVGLNLNPSMTAAEAAANPAQASIYAVDSSYSAALIFANKATGAVGNALTERMRINAGAPILCLAGGSTSATGTGIAFPATQSASSNANTLDDYEEGTWTVTDASGAGLSITTGFAFYTKIGDFIFACCDIQYPTTSNTSGARFTLPFSGKNYSNGFVGYSSYVTSPITLESDNNSGNMVIYNSVYGNITNASFSGIRLISTFVYKAS